MTPADFLRAVWPGEGIYCLAIPRGNGAFRHWTFDTIEDAAAQAEKFAATSDVYFNIHTLKEKQVPHLTDPDKTQVRVQRNMRSARAFFFDLDVGNGGGKYETQVEALAALIRFSQDTGLPRPLVTSSGGGLHVYWRLTEEIESNAWRDTATQLRQLAQHYGLKADPSRTTDTSSVLRVAGTFNWKDRHNPRAVKVLAIGPETGTGVFLKHLRDAIIEAGIEPKLAPRLVQAEGLESNTGMPYDGPQPSPVSVLTACAQMKRLAMLRGNFIEPEWYRAVIGVGRFVENGPRFIHNLSRGHPGYSEASCNAKIAQSESVQKGPSSCASIAAVSAVGDSLCVGCPFQGKVFGPIQAALYTDPAPPPVVEEEIGGEIIAVTIPDPPPPFTRKKDGGISVLAKDASGEERHQLVYEYDLYPVRRLVNPIAGTEQHVWHVELPRSEAKDFTLEADMLYDIRKFTMAISNQGVYPEKGQLARLQEYMVAYISQLQKLVDADTQSNHLGWSDEHTRFILPDKVIYSDGTAKPAQLSLGAQRASAHVVRRGDLKAQVSLLGFYNHAAYLPNQFYVLAGLAAPIFYMTGHHGVIINASGDAGASKSTSLYTAASFWGQPELYPINGTNNGATVRGRNERVTVLANLPVCVDEITHMPVNDAVDLAMSITQPGHRIRLQSDGVERAAIDSYKATIMLATANSSLHGMLSTNNSAGTAGSMRVVEIMFKAVGVHQKFEADDYLDALKQNYGHIGEVFITHVLKNQSGVKSRVRTVMKEIDLAARIQPSERFWSATMAVVLVAGEIARELGLLSYSVEALRQWVLEYQIPYMRGVVKEEYSDPMAILADFLEQSNSNMIVVEKTQSAIGTSWHIPRKPTGPLYVHYDRNDQLVYVLKKSFKDYCVRVGANATKIIEDLSILRDGSPIICQKHTRRTLGAGTEFAKAQSWCFVVNMAHREVTGAVDLKVVGGSDGATKPGLQAVQ